MKYFKNIETLEQLRKEYNRLVKENHPDNGGSDEAIKIINVEYEELFKVLKNSDTSENKRKYNMAEDDLPDSHNKKYYNLFSEKSTGCVRQS